MSTLYVSDLDGTLLRSNQVTSEYTNHVINSLTDKGMIFSYATARSLITAKKVTQQWLEIMPFSASKSNAIKQLQRLLKCDRLVVFGDGRNDIDMFELADESYAVQNAHEDLKKYATAIIPSNDEDGVAKWLDSTFHGPFPDFIEPDIQCDSDRALEVLLEHLRRQ